MIAAGLTGGQVTCSCTGSPTMCSWLGCASRRPGACDRRRPSLRPPAQGLTAAADKAACRRRLDAGVTYAGATAAGALLLGIRSTAWACRAGLVAGDEPACCRGGDRTGDRRTAAAPRHRPGHARPAAAAEALLIRLVRGAGRAACTSVAAAAGRRGQYRAARWVSWSRGRASLSARSPSCCSPRWPTPAGAFLRNWSTGCPTNWTTMPSRWP